MRHIISFAVAIVFAMSAMVSSSLAQATTAPSPRSSVMIFPFRQVGDATAHGWVAEALQDQLTSAVSGSTAVQVMPYDKALGAASPEAALAAARTAQADYVVYGTDQVVNETLRINGHVEDAVKQQQIATLQATGDMKDFFKLEDNLAQQLRRNFPSMNEPNYGISTSLPDNYYSASTTTPAPSGIYPYDNGAQPNTDNQYGGGTNVYPQTSSYPGYDYGDYDGYYPYYSTYPYYGYSSIYPYYGYGYYPSGFSFGFVGGYNFHNHYYDHGNHYHYGGGSVYHPGNSGFHGSTPFYTTPRSFGSTYRGGFNNGGAFHGGGAFRGGGGFHGGMGGGHR